MVLDKIPMHKDISISEIRKIATPPISALIKKNNGIVNKAECYLFIKAYILMIQRFYGISWDTHQLDDSAKEFYNNYYYWTQLDLKNFAGKCKRMEFDKLLSVNQFSPMTFMSWAAIYDREWLEHSEEIAHLKIDSTNYDPIRETEIYKRDMADQVNAKTDREKIQNMKALIEYQQGLLEKQK
jgi:hypothetical protein